MIKMSFFCLAHPVFSKLQVNGGYCSRKFVDYVCICYAFTDNILLLFIYRYLRKEIIVVSLMCLGRGVAPC